MGQKLRFVVEYDNDTGPDDDGFCEWWEVCDQLTKKTVCRCLDQTWAEIICSALNCSPLHPSMNVVGTETGRLSSQEPVQVSEATTMKVDDGWVEASRLLPACDQYITAEVNLGGELQFVKGRVDHFNPHTVLFDYWTGVGWAEIIRWQPRTPSREPGHPWTSIERGCP